MILVLRLFGAEVLHLEVGDGESVEAAREVDTGSAVIENAGPQLVGFSVPPRKQEEE